MDSSSIQTTAGTVVAVFLLVGCLYAAWRTTRKQADEKEADRTISALSTRANVLKDERNEAATQRDLAIARAEHADQQVETLRGLADNTTRLDKIIQLLQSQDDILRRIEERGRADT